MCDRYLRCFLRDHLKGLLKGMYRGFRKEVLVGLLQGSSDLVTRVKNKVTLLNNYF